MEFYERGRNKHGQRKKRQKYDDIHVNSTKFERSRRHAHDSPYLADVLNFRIGFCKQYIFVRKRIIKNSVSSTIKIR